MCPNSEAGRQFIYESTRSIFSRVQGLGGVINISLGEHGSSCLDSVGAEVDRRPDCPRCSRVPNWQTLAAGQGAMARGIKDGDPNAEYICWLYMPSWRPLAPWVYELGAHMPKDVTLQVNFESGAVKYQLDRPRVGGDYWLSFVGPSERFARIAGQAAAHKTPMSAKLQVGCSHESATIPFMPVPSILYRKYKEMPALNITSVMQCWYFGNYPGVMNRAAGRLAFEDFSGTEDDFLRTLARSEWGDDADNVVRAWKHFAEGFQHFPLSTRFQWWGPMHATPVWPLHLKPALKPLQPTWLVGGPCGDAIGEALDNHTLAEAVILARKMSEEWDKGVAILKSLEPGFRGNRERMLDIGLTEAIGIQFASAHNMLNFYLMRSRLFDLPPADALRHLAAMEAIVRQEIRNSERLDCALCRGFAPGISFRGRAAPVLRHAVEVARRGAERPAGDRVPRIPGRIRSREAGVAVRRRARGVHLRVGVDRLQDVPVAGRVRQRQPRASRRNEGLEGAGILCGICWPFSRC